MNKKLVALLSAAALLLSSSVLFAAEQEGFIARMRNKFFNKEKAPEQVVVKTQKPAAPITAAVVKKAEAPAAHKPAAPEVNKPETSPKKIKQH